MYQNRILSFFTCPLSKFSGIKIKCYIQTKSQDGKCIVQGHFTIAVAYVTVYVKYQRNVPCASQLFFALSFVKSVNNSSNHMTAVDCNFVQQLMVGYKKNKKTIDSLIPGCNEVVFLDDDASSTKIDWYMYSNGDTIGPYEMDVSRLVEEYKGQKQAKSRKEKTEVQAETLMLMKILLSNMVWFEAWVILRQRKINQVATNMASI